MLCFTPLNSTVQESISPMHPLLINLGVQENFDPGPPKTLKAAQGVVLYTVLQASPKCTAHHPPPP